MDGTSVESEDDIEQQRCSEAAKDEERSKENGCEVDVMSPFFCEVGGHRDGVVGSRDSILTDRIYHPVRCKISL
jgi:hypothetical protein